MTRRLNIWLLAILLILGLPFYWLLLDNRAGDAVAQPVSIGRLRDLASSRPGEAPVAVRYEAVGKSLRMGNLSGAGTGFRFNPIYILSYMIEYREAPPIIIGSGLTRAQAEALNFTKYSSAAQSRVFSALQRANRIITLGRETTQTGGLKALQGQPELTHPALLDKGEAARSGRRPYVPAPGVVVIPTPDRLQGTRLVYVRLENGREYVFAGNLSRTSRNWVELRVPARIITDLVQPEDRREALSWLLTLQELKRQAPDLVIITGNQIPRNVGVKRFFSSARQDSSGNKRLDIEGDFR